MNAYLALDELDFDSESQLMGFSFPTFESDTVPQDRLNVEFPAHSLLFSVEPGFLGETAELDNAELDFSMEVDVLDHDGAFEAGPLDDQLEIVNCFNRLYPQIEDCDDFDAYDSDDASMASSGRSTPFASFPSTPNNIAMNISEADIDGLQLKSLNYRRKETNNILYPEGFLFDKHPHFHHLDNNFVTSLVVPVSGY